MPQYSNYIFEARKYVDQVEAEYRRIKNKKKSYRMKRPETILNNPPPLVTKATPDPSVPTVAMSYLTSPTQPRTLESNVVVDFDYNSSESDGQKSCSLENEVVPCSCSSTNEQMAASNSEYLLELFESSDVDEYL